MNDVKTMRPESETGFQEFYGNLLARRADAQPEMNLPLMHLNRRMWGLTRRTIMVIGARPSEGKSALALNFSLALAKQGKKVEFLTLEMSVEAMMKRCVSMECGIDNYRLKTGNLRDEELRQIEAFRDVLASWPIHFSRHAAYTAEDLEAHLETTKPDVVVIDYIQSIRAFGKNKLDGIERYLDGLERFKIEYNCVILLCSQINRTIKMNPDHLPTKEDLKGAGRLEEVADQILLNHYPCKWIDRKNADGTENLKYDMTEFYINVAKDKEGETWVERVRYEPTTYTFRDYP